MNSKIIDINTTRVTLTNMPAFPQKTSFNEIIFKMRKTFRCEKRATTKYCAKRIKEKQ